jgi:hypothetical protein
MERRQHEAPQSVSISDTPCRDEVAKNNSKYALDNQRSC